VERNAISRVWTIPTTAGLQIQSVLDSQGGWAQEALLVTTEKSGGNVSCPSIDKFESALPRFAKVICR